MPGRLNFIAKKLKNNGSVEKDDLIIVETNSNSNILDNENAKMSETDFKNNWFRTWPDRDYEKLYQNIDSLTFKDENQTLKKIDKVESQVPLNKLLDEIPLAYSPITKQLHVLTKKEQQKNLNKSYNCSEVLESNDEEIDQFRTKKFEINLNGKKPILQTCFNQSVDNQKEKLQNNKDGYSNEKYDNCDKSKGDQCNLTTEATSFSSVILSFSDNSPTNGDENGSGHFSFLESDDLSIRSHYSQDSGSTYGENSKFFESRGSWNKEDNKKKGLSGFFSRNVFAWKTGAPLTSQGWKLFGKTLGQEAESCRISNAEINSQHSANNSPLSIKKYEDLIASSSALILHNRPADLPSKSIDEHLKHKLEYEQIVEAARRKEVKESKKRKKQMQQQLKFEEQLSNASKIWNTEILPKWNSVKNTKKVRELWWAGIPPSVRGKIWKLAIGNELNITYQLYDICVARAQERLKNTEINSQDDCAGGDKESSVELIQLDISRTFPQLCIFQKGGPYYDILHCLLGAYVCYRPDVGYVQGMSFIAAVLILNLEPPDAFISFANLLNRSCHMAFFSLNQSFMLAYYDTYNIFFKENLPKLCQHFQESSLTPDLYLLDWVYSVFAKAMPLDVACRIWDVFLRDGEEFLFRTALGVLHLHQDKLLKLDFISGAQFLTKLPEDISANLLFKSIESIKMSIGKLKFSQVLSDKYSSR